MSLSFSVKPRAFIREHARLSKKSLLANGTPERIVAKLSSREAIAMCDEMNTRFFGTK